MMADEVEELRRELIAAREGFRRIATALGVEHRIAATSAGWHELASQVERRLRRSPSGRGVTDERLSGMDNDCG